MSTPSFPENITPEYTDTEEITAKKILLALWGSVQTPGNVIQVALGSSSGGSGSQTVSGSTKSSSGSTAAGASQVTFVAETGFTGTVAGVTVAAGTTITFSSAPGNTLGAIAYTVSAGNLGIITVV